MVCVCVWRDEETAAFLELLHEVKCGQEGNATQYQELPPFLHRLLFQWYNNNNNGESRRKIAPSTAYFCVQLQILAQNEKAHNIRHTD